MDRAKIKSAFLKGQLQVRSVDRGASPASEWATISDVMRHECPHKRIFRVTAELENALRESVVVTEDHSLIAYPSLQDVRTSDLSIGDSILVVLQGALLGGSIVELALLPSRQYMFDLCIPKNENFVLQSGIVAHNSYSISGVSLDIEKSSKYQSMMDAVGAEYDKVVDAAKRSIKIAKGLRQFRYGVGITSALGPLNRPGVQSRRNMLDSSLGPGFV